MRIIKLVPVIFFFAFIVVVLLLNQASPAAIGADGSELYLPAIMRAEDSTPTPTATHQPPPPPTNTPIPTATNQPLPAGCSICSYDAYNCSDFNTQSQAQSCHDYCWQQVGYDVHGLDADNNGEACESLP